VADGTEPGSRIFVEQMWSSWFELVVPEDPVFVDSRIELFPAEVWNDYLLVLSAEDGWDEILDRWKIGVLVISRQRLGLTSAAREHPGWSLLHQDVDGSVFVRAGSPSPEDGSP
jgi:hypothetical protein